MSTRPNKRIRRNSFRVNEVIFIVQAKCVALFCLLAAFKGKEALTALICTFTLLANIFVLKQVELFSMTVTTTDVFSIGILLCCNILQEFHGKRAAKNAIFFSFATMLLFVISSFLLTAYTPHYTDIYHSHYDAIITPSPRLFIASIIAFTSTQIIDRRIFIYLRRNIFVGSLPLAFVVSLVVSQCIDTFLFTTIGLYGVVGNIIDISIFSIIIKTCGVAVMTPFTLFIKYLSTQNEALPL